MSMFVVRSTTDLNDRCSSDYKWLHNFSLEKNAEFIWLPKLMDLITNIVQTNIPIKYLA